MPKPTKRVTTDQRELPLGRKMPEYIVVIVGQTKSCAHHKKRDNTYGFLRLEELKPRAKAGAFSLCAHGVQDSCHGAASRYRGKDYRNKQVLAVRRAPDSGMCGMQIPQRRLPTRENILC